MATIRFSQENVRGCGFRKSGGLYLVGGQLAAPCGKLPIELSVCPTCSCGIKPARGWTWIDPVPLFHARACTGPSHEWPEIMRDCPTCPLGLEFTKMRRAGLLWVGEKFYPTADDYLREAHEMGVSRRIKSVPKDFQPGVTCVFLAHRKAISRLSENRTPELYREVELKPGIFAFFRPTAVEYVVKGNESEEELETLEKRGLSLVKVEPIYPTDSEQESWLS